MFWNKIRIKIHANYLDSVITTVKTIKIKSKNMKILKRKYLIKYNFVKYKIINLISQKKHVYKTNLVVVDSERRWVLYTKNVS